MSSETELHTSPPILGKNKYVNHPTADISLVSNDNVILRTHAYFLRHASMVFRGMLDNELGAVPAPGKNNNHIPFDAPASHLSLFLQCVDFAPNVHRFSRSECDIIIALCDKWDCPDIRHHALRALSRIGPDPGDMFRTGCRTNDMNLAFSGFSGTAWDDRYALVLPWQMSDSDLDAISPPMLKRLCKAVSAYSDWHRAHIQESTRADDSLSWNWNVFMEYWTRGGLD